MSTQSQIDRIKAGVSDALNAVSERGVEVSDEDNVDSLGGLIRSIPSGGSYPTLTATQRNAIVTLVNQYYNARIAGSAYNFVYTGGVDRNYYADTRCYNNNGQVKLNCSTFVQLLWAGISPDSFLGKQSNFNGAAVKTFDWGYWFKFPFRKLYHLTAPNGPTGKLTMYGYVQPDPSTYEGSYSITTYYSPNGTAENKYQMPLTYMRACDMARELRTMGCEIPLSKAMTGDIVFMKADRLDDNQEDETENASYENINHVAIITNVSGIMDCDLTFAECSTYYDSVIGVSKISHTSAANVFRAGAIMDRIVMVARHPAAFGIENLVPDVITTI